MTFSEKLIPNIHIYDGQYIEERGLFIELGDVDKLGIFSNNSMYKSNDINIKFLKNIYIS